MSKVFLYRSGDTAKPRVFLVAPTGVAAININGNTVHSGLHIPCRGKLISSQKLSLSLLVKYQRFHVNCFIRYINA